LNAETLVAIAAIAFLAAVCQSVTAFGFALVMVPLLTVAWDVQPAVVTSTLLSTSFMIPLLYEVRSRVEPMAIAPLLAGSIVGVPVGVVVLTQVDATVLQVGVAVTVLVAALTLFSSPQGGVAQPHVVTAFLAGGLSGALRAATSMSGPPVVLYALSRFGSDVERFRANVLGVLLPGSLVTIAAVALAGLIDGEVLLACLAAAPTMLIGTALGARLRGRVRPEVFRQVVLLVLVVATGVILVSALTKL
jgi:uncharacterized membrane protein YfcA